MPKTSRKSAKRKSSVVRTSRPRAAYQKLHQQNPNLYWLLPLLCATLFVAALLLVHHMREDSNVMEDTSTKQMLLDKIQNHDKDGTVVASPRPTPSPVLLKK